MPEFIVTPAEALEFGWSIIPTDAHKMALVPWKDYQTRHPTKDELETWEKRKPPAWAIVTGAISARISLDFDGQQGRETIQHLKIPAHRSTPAGGYHADFVHPGWRVSTLNGKTDKELGSQWPGLDIRADGGYVLFTGRTEKGQYVWLREPNPHQLEILPEGLREHLGLSKPPTETTIEKRQQHPASVFPTVPTQALLDRAIKLIGSTGRNASGFWLATQLRDNRYNMTAAREVMQSFRANCPPLNRKGQPEEYTEAEMLRSLNQAYLRAPRQHWTESPEEPTAEEPDQKIDKHFRKIGGAVYHIDEETGARNFVCTELDVVAHARDGNSERWGRLLKWMDLVGKKHSWIAPNKMLVGDGLTFREILADGGVSIGASNKLLIQYVRSQSPEKFMYCVPNVGWFDRTFVFPESTIPLNTNVGYQSEGRGEHFYRSMGTLESWQEHIGRKCIGNSRLIFAVSAALAGPLMRPLNIQGGGFHFRSTSSKGKSTTQWIAGSVWGGGGHNGFARTWGATKNALESIAEMHNDGCLILDEMRMIEARDVEQIIYMLANGSGKARENRNMTGRRTLQWLCMILSSGEIQLSDSAALAGQKIKGGAEIRMATIPGEAPGAMGIFETLHGTDDPGTFAEKLEAGAKCHYGTVIPKFLECLIATWDDTIERGQRFIEDFATEYLPTGAAGEIKRVLRRFAVAAFAGEMATEWEITGWSEDNAREAAMRCFNGWIDEHGIEATDTRNAFLQIRDILATSQHSRFLPADPGYNKDGNLDVPRIQSCLGYTRTIESQRFFLVDRGAFKNELCKGFNEKDAARDLRKRGLLTTETHEHLTKQQTITTPTGDKERIPFYCISAKILEC